MLEQLIGSKTRVKLLQLFLEYPDKPFYVRELARAAGTQINSIRRELNNLERLGIIAVVDLEAKTPVGEDGEIHEAKTEPEKPLQKLKKQKKYFQANGDFLLFDDLKSVFRKAKFLLEKDFATQLQNTGSYTYLALTGAFMGLSGAPTDILIVGRVNKVLIKKMVARFEKETRHDIKYTIMDKEEFQYRFNIVDKFLFDILDLPKVVVVDKRKII